MLANDELCVAVSHKSFLPPVGEGTPSVNVNCKDELVG